MTIIKVVKLYEENYDMNGKPVEGRVKPVVLHDDHSQFLVRRINFMSDMAGYLKIKNGGKSQFFMNRGKHVSFNRVSNRVELEIFGMVNDEIFSGVDLGVIPKRKL